MGAAATIYMDHSATTPLRPEALEAMLPFLGTDGSVGGGEGLWANPSSVHRPGQKARRAIDRARDQVAAAIGAQPSEVVFTSSGTEADNLALIGAALANAERGRHLVVSAIEHHAVLKAAELLEGLGWQVTRIAPGPDGRVAPAEVEAALTGSTVLVSVMQANNEVGVLQPVEAIAALARERGILVHTDAVQSPGRVPVDVRRLGVDLLSLSAHKFYGPKGAGLLYVRKGTRIHPWLVGGAQERGLRAGTENAAAIAGMARALELAVQEQPAEQERLRRLEERFLEGLQQRLGEVTVNGEGAPRLPGLLNLDLGVDAQSLLVQLDIAGVAASSGAACSAGSLLPSHVLLAMGRGEAAARRSVRFSLGRCNTQEQMERAAALVAEKVLRLRSAQGWERRFVPAQAVPSVTSKPLTR